ncbi:NADPH-dependent F420 reductase [Luedemannella helvata]|uniref:NADPH-dependent F420 reductase n=1 Tax=Luedemannella helvata TaxID=349315 RepID=A0ABP4WNV8_9ACTN
MRIGVLGTGDVGRTLAGRLVELGHEVTMGSRSVANEAAARWLAELGTPLSASIGTFADAAGRAELVINATSGAASLDALALAGADRLADKIILDVANPLTFAGGAPALSLSNTDSLGEAIQREYPSSLVVKSLNTVNCEVMVRPHRVPGAHTMFLAGDDPEAKATVGDLLHAFGWKHLLDLGGIEAARGMEMYVMLWIRLRLAQGSDLFNVQVVTG